MPSIGSITVDSMKNAIPRFGEAMVERTRPRVDGHAFGHIGLRSMDGSIDTVEAVTTATKVEREKQYKALEGTVVAVEDGYGETRAHVAVISVAIAPDDMIEGYGFGTTGATVLLRATWQLKDLDING